MRTRNRGKRNSIVSSMGLCPKIDRRRRTLQTLASNRCTRRQATRNKMITRTKLSSEENSHNATQVVYPKMRKNLSRKLYVGRSLAKPHKRTSNRKTCVTPPAVVQSQSRKSREYKVLEQSDDSNTVMRMSGTRTLNKSPRPGRKRRFSNVSKPSFSGLHACVCEKDSKRSQVIVAPASNQKLGSVRSVPPTKCSSSMPTKSRHRHVSHSDVCALTSGVRGTRKLCQRASEVPGLFDLVPSVNQALSCTKSDHQIEASIEPLGTSLPVKRRRGRPSASAASVVKVDTGKILSLSVPKKLAHLSASSEISKLSQPIFTKCKPKNCFEHTVLKTETPSKLVPANFVSPFGDLRFGASDKVLEEILNEINTSGCVPRIVKPFEHSKRKTLAVHDVAQITADTQFVFDASIISTVFENMWQTADILVGLETKDLFLALSGLLRPGVCELWRRNREDQTKQLSRSVMGRLRPNPRPRRYSDMIISNSIGQSASQLSVRHLSDATVGSEKCRQGSRSLFLAAARLTAAKRLIRARSHQTALPATLISLKSERLRSSRKECVPSLRELDSEKLSRRPRKLTAQLSPTTRSRRRPDVSHHIDWKFCYTSTDKENANVSPLNVTPRRKRKVSTVVQQTEAGIAEDSQSHSFVEENRYIDSENEKLHSEVSEECPKIAEPVAENELDNLIVEVHPKKEKSPVQSDPSLVLRERQTDFRRKRRHALTVQRKRPVDRLPTGLRRKEIDFWRPNRSVSAELEDELSSVSSSTSFSATADAYGRVFRPSRLFQQQSTRGVNLKHSRSLSTKRPAPIRSTSSKIVPSLNGGKKRHVSTRRPTLPVRVGPPLSPRQRITRRPDRMCQLTLLDRLVLGLNCSVSQNEEEIHIKQLHAEELNILTQRINKTGFFIQSLALRTNANNDAEYNLVLTFSPGAELGTRRVRHTNSSTRSRLVSLDNSEYSPERSASRSSWRKPRSKNRSEKRLKHLKVNPLFEQPLKTQRFGGYLSDSALSASQHPLSSKSAYRNAYSDNEDADVSNIRPIETVAAQLSGTESSPSASHGVRIHAPCVMRSEDLCERLSLRTFASSTLVSEIHSSLHRKTVVKQSERWSYSSESTSVRKRSVSSSKHEAEQNAAESDAQVTIGLSSHTSRVHGLPKRLSRVNALGVQIAPPFRRHSPRKVIRKVYTGSLTIPKILNRKRPAGAPPVTASAPVCSSLTNVSSSAHVSTTINQNLSTIVTTTTCTSTHPTAHIHCVNAPATPTVIFEEPNLPLPVYPHTPAPTIPIQYRRLPTAFSGLPTPARAPEHLSLNFTQVRAASPAQPYLSENRPSNVLRVCNITSTVLPCPTTSLAHTPTKLSNLDDKDDVIITSAANALHKDSVAVGTTNLTSVPPLEQAHPIYSSKKAVTPSVYTTVEGHAVRERTTVASPSSDAKIRVRLGSPESNGPFSLVNQKVIDDADSAADQDDSHTPATSMSASQLLKLKRLHDEVCRSPACHPNDCRSTPYFSPPTTRVQSPSQPSVSRQPSQAQPIESDAGNSRGRQSDQFDHPQEFLSQSSSLPSQGPTKLGPNVCSLPTYLGPPKLDTSIPPYVPCEDDESEDFELKTVTKTYESCFGISPHSTTLAARAPVNALAEGCVPNSTVRKIPDLPPFHTAVPFSNAMHHLRPTWPAVRPTMYPVSHPPVFGVPVTTPGFTVVHNLIPAKQPTSFDPITPNQVATRFVFQNPSTRVPDVAALPDADGDFNQTNLSNTLSTVGIVHMDAGSRGYGSQSTGLPIISVPSKRTVVHKYHSFRKILPKSPEHSSCASGPLTAGAAYMNVSHLNSSTPRLTQLPMVTGLYRSGSLSQTPTSLTCDVLQNDAYFVDITQDISTGVGHNKSLEHAAFISGVSTNPASQLLKSLLESDSKDSPGTLPVSVSGTAAVTTTTSMMSASTPASTTSGSVTWNQPAHHSRGTWQLGRRVVSGGTHRSSVDPSSHPLGRPSQSNASDVPRPPPKATDATEGKEPKSIVPAVLPPSIRLVPGPTSRLQQLHQHHQRRQQLQQEQRQAQKHSDQAAPNNSS
ncbi:hypothetical protein EG68_05519 [Paragonimus skrjabini miyazakii]|uniref:Uncharacterized protein n=1 Tax=Paragonimus skrjabini miyazakii TaxID=59628 RepID=A0A8S9YRU5_9TREM|nr:hypothetical protein EG68_05519 [Paragonimus skrjabini miyazakii]